MTRQHVATASCLLMLLFLAVPSTFAQSWAFTGRLQHDRVYHTETLLQNGEVLITGGVNNNGQTMALAELYNPATGTFSFTGSLNHDRKFHTATLLPNGQVLIVGGENNDGQPMALCELYNPSTGTFSFTGSLHQARSLHTATLLQNGKVLVAGGYISSKETGTTASAELYDPATGTWSFTGSLPQALARATATLLQNGNVLVATGLDNNSSPLKTAELYDPATGTFSSTGSLFEPRVWDTATLLQNGQVLIAGGQLANLQPGNICELYNPATGTFSLTAGSLHQARSFHTATLLQNGEVLIAGGYTGFNHTNTTATAELYNPTTEEWTFTASLPHDLARATAALLQNGQVLVAAGVNNDGSTINIAELFTF